MRFDPKPPKAPKPDTTRPTAETAIFKNTHAVLEAVYAGTPYRIPENGAGSNHLLIENRRNSKLHRIKEIYQTPALSRQPSQQASRQSSPAAADLTPLRRQPSVAFDAPSSSRRSSSSDAFLPPVRGQRSQRVQSSEQPFLLSSSQIGMFRSSSARTARGPRRKPISFIDLPQEFLDSGVKPRR